jgi:hypothetical protein
LAANLGKARHGDGGVILEGSAPVVHTANENGGTKAPPFVSHKEVRSVRGE